MDGTFVVLEKNMAIQTTTSGWVCKVTRCLQSMDGAHFPQLLGTSATGESRDVRHTTHRATFTVPPSSPQHFGFVIRRRADLLGNRARHPETASWSDCSGASAIRRRRRNERQRDTATTAAVDGLIPRYRPAGETGFSLSLPESRPTHARRRRRFPPWHALVSTTDKATTLAMPQNSSHTRLPD